MKHGFDGAIRRVSKSPVCPFLLIPAEAGIQFLPRASAERTAFRTLSASLRSDAGIAAVWRSGRGWRPAVVGTGGIQEDRVPGASERWPRRAATCRNLRGYARCAFREMPGGPCAPRLSFGTASRRVSAWNLPVDVPPRGCERHRCQTLASTATGRL